MNQVEWQKLTKEERRQLRRQLRRERQEAVLKKSRLVPIKSGLVVLGVIGFLLMGYFAISFFNQQRYASAPRLEISPTSFDFGQVWLSQGRVETSFAIKNSGQADLVIKGMQSSCDCTSARLKFKGEESPLFGMHQNSTNWTAALKPGDSGQLVVYYDAKLHPVSGPVTRTVTVFSNDPASPEKEVTIYANVRS